MDALKAQHVFACHGVPASRCVAERGDREDVVVGVGLAHGKVGEIGAFVSFSASGCDERLGG
jgi:hypothetical protein